MVGSAESSAIVQTPEPSHPAPDTSNSIVSSPAAPLAAVIAARRLSRAGVARVRDREGGGGAAVAGAESRGAHVDAAIVKATHGRSALQSVTQIVDGPSDH